MKIFLDSANVDEVTYCFDKYPWLAGLTTTPAMLARDYKGDVDEALAEFSMIAPELHVEALGRTSREIREEVRRLESLGLTRQKTVFKVPVSPHALAAVHTMKKHKYRFNVHCVNTLAQAVMAEAAGAEYVCFMTGKYEDEGYDARPMLKDLGRVWETSVMYSSVRSTRDLIRALHAEIDVVTIPPAILNKHFNNTMTSEQEARFWEAEYE